MTKPFFHSFCFIAFLIPCVPAVAHPVPESPQWLTYAGGEGPGKGKHIVLIAADQEYRSEQSMPMLAKILSKHHGFDCTVLFAVNEKGEVDPTMPVYPEKGKEFKQHHIPGLEHLASADLVIFFNRLLTLPMEERELIVKYIDSGKPIIAIRTANHGFHAALPYKINGKAVNWGNDVLGGTSGQSHLSSSARVRWRPAPGEGMLLPSSRSFAAKFNFLPTEGACAWTPKRPMVCCAFFETFMIRVRLTPATRCAI